jgi:hypothetical protein
MSVVVRFSAKGKVCSDSSKTTTEVTQFPGWSAFDKHCYSRIISNISHVRFARCVGSTGCCAHLPNCVFGYIPKQFGCPADPTITTQVPNDLESRSRYGSERQLGQKRQNLMARHQNARRKRAAIRVRMCSTLGYRVGSFCRAEISAARIGPRSVCDRAFSRGGSCGLSPEPSQYLHDLRDRAEQFVPIRQDAQGKSE